MYHLNSFAATAGLMGAVRFTQSTAIAKCCSCILTRSIAAAVAVVKSAINLQRTHRWVEVCSFGMQSMKCVWGNLRNTRVQSTEIASIRVIHANIICMQPFTRADACERRMITCSLSSSSRPCCWQQSQFCTRHMQIVGT